MSNHLKKHLPQENKVVDFLIPHEAANIFIDAKGVEIHERGMVTLSHSEISGRIKKLSIKKQSNKRTPLIGKSLTHLN